MKKQMAALLGGTAALVAVPAAHAMAPAPQPGPTLAASSYAELLEPVPNAVDALKASDAAAPPARFLLTQYHHHHHHHNSVWPGAIIGGVIGGMIAAPSYAPPPPPPVYYDRSVEWCMHHYRSYDVRTHTYLGYDGYRHPCP